MVGTWNLVWRWTIVIRIKIRSKFQLHHYSSSLLCHIFEDIINFWHFSCSKHIKKMMIMKVFLKMLWVIENEQAPEIKLYLVEINLLNKSTKINLLEISLFRWDQYKQFESCSKRLKAGPILEIKGMGVIFKKEGKIFENLGKIVWNLKFFLKRGRWLHALITCNKLLE